MTLPIIVRSGNYAPVRRNTYAPAAGATRPDPWNDLAHLDQLFAGLFGAPASQVVAEQLVAKQSKPVVEVYETADQLTAFVFSPGIIQDDLDISVTGDTVTIKGERKPLLEVAEGLISHTPSSQYATSGSSFDFNFTLPVDVDVEKVQAVYKDGVLQITLPKIEAVKPKQVKVEVQQS